jgi:hypothetical protein
MSIPSLVQWPTPSTGDPRALDPMAPGSSNARPSSAAMVFQSTLDDFLCNGWSTTAASRGGDMRTEARISVDGEPTGLAGEGLAGEGLAGEGLAGEGLAGDGAETEEWPPIEAALDSALSYGAHVVTLPFPPPPSPEPVANARGAVTGANIEAALSSPLTELAWSTSAPSSSKAGTEAAQESVALAASSAFWSASSSNATRLGPSTRRSGEASSAKTPPDGVERRRASTQRAGGPGAPQSTPRTAVSTLVPSHFERPASLDPLPGFVTSLSVESVPLAATPRGMRAATPEQWVREKGAAELDEALRRSVPEEQPSLPPALRSDRPAPLSPVAETEDLSVAEEGRVEEPLDFTRAAPALEPLGVSGLPVQVSPLREDSPLLEAVARFTEESRQSTEAREARQADVERSVDAMTLSRRVVADALLEGGERVRIEAVPEDRSVALDVRLDNRETADLLTLVRGDLMAQLEGSPVTRISVGFQSFDASAGHDRQGRGGHPSAGRQEEGSPSPAPAPLQAAPTGNGRVRVVL